MLKRRFRRERVDCLDDLVTVVEASAVSNTAQLVGREDGTTYVNMYDWTPFLAPHFKRIPGMKQYHHFEISSSIPGVLKLKFFADSDPVELLFCSPIGHHQSAIYQLSFHHLVYLMNGRNTCMTVSDRIVHQQLKTWCVPYQKLELTPKKKTWMMQKVISHLDQKPHRQQRDPGIVACVARLDTMPDFTKTRHAHIHDQHNTRS